jgi:hypothetical protein
VTRCVTRQRHGKHAPIAYDIVPATKVDKLGREIAKWSVFNPAHAREKVIWQ